MELKSTIQIDLQAKITLNEHLIVTFTKNGEGLNSNLPEHAPGSDSIFMTIQFIR